MMLIMLNKKSEGHERYFISSCVDKGKSVPNPVIADSLQRGLKHGYWVLSERPLLV